MAIENAEVVFLSVVSLWEATIKYQLGKLPLPEAPYPWLFNQSDQHGFASLPVDGRSVARLSTLHPHHRDPFDRMLVCQALEHELQIVTVDPVFSNYPVKQFRPA
jgi:PIN domain nuclease of toxin-antitoxin system